MGRWRRIAVGFVVFLILVIVQFIVITKGSERVAEVAARFTLDAMPGKQMSIDADLNAGLINEQKQENDGKKLKEKLISMERWMVQVNLLKVMLLQVLLLLLLILLVVLLLV